MGKQITQKVQASVDAIIVNKQKGIEKSPRRSTAMRHDKDETRTNDTNDTKHNDIRDNNQSVHNDDISNESQPNRHNSESRSYRHNSIIIISSNTKYEKGSRFPGFSALVSSQSEINEFLSSITDRFPRPVVHRIQ